MHPYRQLPPLPRIQPTLSIPPHSLLPLPFPRNHTFPDQPLRLLLRQPIRPLLVHPSNDIAQELFRLFPLTFRRRQNPLHPTLPSTARLTCLPTHDNPLLNGVRGENGVAPINLQVLGAELVAVAVIEAGIAAAAVN